MGTIVFDVKQLNASYGEELVLKNLRNWKIDFFRMYSWKYSSKSNHECD